VISHLLYRGARLGQPERFGDGGSVLVGLQAAVCESRVPRREFDDLGLHDERPHEPTEVRDDDRVGFSGLGGSALPCPLHEGCAARHVELLEQLHDLDSVTVAHRRDTLPLIVRRHETRALAIAYAADAHDPDDPTALGGTLASNRRFPCS
jgi:hypothetical protein